MIGTKQVMNAERKSRRAKRMPTGAPSRTKKKLPQAMAVRIRRSVSYSFHRCCQNA